MSNIIQDITKGLSGIFKSGAKGSVIGVDVGSSAIKIVQLKNENGVAVLETYGAVSLGSYVDGSYVGQAVNPNHDQTIQAIGDLIKEANITTMNSAVGIPSASSLVFLIELPPTVSEKELATVVPTEARRYIPVPITEVSLDWWVIPEQRVVEGTDDSPEQEQEAKDRPKRILVAAIHNEALSRFQEVVRDSKLQTGFFEIEMFSNVRSCVGQDLSTVVLIDFGASKTKVSIVNRGVLQDFHIINRGSQDITRVLSTGLNVPLKKAEEIKKKFGMGESSEFPQAAGIISGSLEYVMAEVNNVILGYEKKHSQSIDKIIVTGGGSAMNGVVDFCSQKLPAPVTKSDPFARVKTPAFLDPVLAEVGSEFGVALGLAMRRLTQ